MTILLALELILFVTLYLMSRNKYKELIEPLDKKKYSLKELFPIAFFIFEKFGCKFNTHYDRRIAARLAELYGARDVKYYLRVHWANKLILMLVTVLLMTFIGVGMGDADGSFWVFTFIVVGMIFYLTDKNIEQQLARKNLMLQYDFPEFLNRLVLLINAGMTVSRAWEKIVADNKKDTPLYRELAFTYAEIQGGKSEPEAYEAFSRRCRTKEITKFVTVILQNLRKGNAELAYILRLQSNECWEMRKGAAKKLGEEASTKLMLPMMLMFLGILMIVMLPAVLQLTNM